MARSKKDDKPAKRRGSAAGVKPGGHRGRTPEVQKSLPGVPDGRIAKLEELDAERTAAKADAKAASELAKDVEQRMVDALEKEFAKSGRDRYRTNSGFIIHVETQKKLKRKPVPKPKARKGQAVPAGVA